MTQIAIGEASWTAIQVMYDYVSEVQKEVNQIFEKLYQVSVKENQWELLYKAAAGLEFMYNKRVLGAAKNKIYEWDKSEGSFVSAATRFRMGDEAEAEAMRQQRWIVNEIESIPEVGLISESQLDFLNTKFELEDIQAKLEGITYHAKELTDIVDRKNRLLRKLSEENGSAKAIANVASPYGASIADFADRVAERVSAFLSEQFDTVEQLNAAGEAEHKQSAEEFSQFIEDTLTSMDKEFEELFG